MTTAYDRRWATAAADARHRAAQLAQQHRNPAPSQPAQRDELRACLRCYAPTPDPERHCT